MTKEWSKRMTTVQEKSPNGAVKSKVTTKTPTTEPAGIVAEIPRLDAETMIVPVVGTAPLIVHKWAEKAKQQMRDAQQGRKAPRTNRDPQADFDATIYRVADEAGGGYGFPVLGFKAATISAARYFGRTTITQAGLRQFVFFRGLPSDDGIYDLVRIDGGDPIMREDMVRVGQGTDLRYRAEFRTWSAQLQVTYVRSSISRESVLSLIDAGGLGVGVGEWRPEKSGDHGTYRLDDDREVEILGGVR